MSYAVLLSVLLGATVGMEAVITASTPSAPALDSRVVELPGRVADWTEICDSKGCDLFFLLSEPVADRDEQNDDAADSDKTGRTLYRYTFVDDQLTSLGPLIRPADADRARSGDSSARLVPHDLDHDGVPEPLVVTSDGIYFLGETGLELLFEASALVPSQVRRLSRLEDGSLPMPTVGWLRWIDLRAPKPRIVAEVAVPLQVTHRATTLELESPRLHRLPGPEETYAVGPEEFGPHRWRLTLIERSEGARFDRRQLFVHTPLAEKPVDASFFRQGEKLFMVAQALRSDRVAILEKKKVRVYELSADRTQQGKGPLLEHFSVSRHWQDLDGYLSDLDGDTLLDLVLLQREGFDGKKVQLDVFYGRGRSGTQTFEQRGRSTVFPVPFADWLYGGDMTGDGVGDLILTSASVSLYPIDPERKKAVSRSPSWEVPLPAASARSWSDVVDGPTPQRQSTEADIGIRWRRPAILDLDGVGRPELISFGRQGRLDRLWILSWRDS